MPRTFVGQLAVFGLLSSLVQFLYTDATNGRYKRSANFRLMNDVTEATKTTPSASGCLVTCSDLPGCISVSWNPQTRECLMSKNSTVDDINLMIRADRLSPWNTFSLMQFKVWHAEGHGGKNTLTRQQADDRCAEEGGRVASPLEVQDAFFAGFELCRWSWMSDNLIGLVLQYPREDCSEYNGIVHSPDQNAMYADVFCTDDL